MNGNIQRGFLVNKLSNCPFCGCSMQIKIGKYPNGDKLIEPSGWHDDDCPLSPVFWYTYLEDNLKDEIKGFMNNDKY